MLDRIWITVADAHLIPATYGRMTLGKSAATAHVLEIVMKDGEKGAGLEIAESWTEKTEIEMTVAVETA